jgi:hypothetical protein
MVEPRPLIDVDRRSRDVEEAVALERRRFLRNLGLAVLTVQSLPIIANAAGMSLLEGETGPDLVIHSGPGLISHVHDLLIPYAVLKAPPPKGIELTTTQALLHRHTVALTREQLIVVNDGGSITKKASSHTFVIALATRPR